MVFQFCALCRRIPANQLLVHAFHIVLYKLIYEFVHQRRDFGCTRHNEAHNSVVRLVYFKAVRAQTIALRTTSTSSIAVSFVSPCL